MRFTYCPDCGSRLIPREIGDEGLVPFCDSCSKPLFDMFPSCVIVLVTDGQGKVALLKQEYISTQYRTLVSGYMKPGETAEEAAAREVKEELGLTLAELRLVRTLWFAKGGMLMIAFIGRAEGGGFALSKEVDGAEWVEAARAPGYMHPPSPGNASRYLTELYARELDNTERGGS